MRKIEEEDKDIEKKGWLNIQHRSLNKIVSLFKKKKVQIIEKNSQHKDKIIG